MKIGILGAGAMGSGIAQVFAMNGNYSIYAQKDIKKAAADLKAAVKAIV